MSFARPTVILNPHAAGGRAARVWRKAQPVLQDRAGKVEVLETERPNHATELTRKALTGGSDLIIAVGGDGTLNEIVNGFFLGGMAIRAGASLGLIPAGTGGDFQRTVQVPLEPEAAAVAIADGESKPMDLARLKLVGHDGRPVERYFLNLTSFGMGGDVSIHAKNNFFTGISGKAAFLWATFSVFLRYRGKTVRLTLDGEPLEEEFVVTNVAIGNGEFHGGGMHPCPKAKLDSGRLEVTVIDRLSMLELIRDIRVLYSEDVYAHPKVRHFHAQRVLAESGETVRAEVDGEALGKLPIEAEVVPGAIRFVGSPVLRSELR